MTPKNVEITNVVIFVGDAVRWDSSADFLSRHGKTIKTVSASLHTPTSFATILSGRHPIQHGVYGFQQQLPDSLDSVFDLTDRNVVFNEGHMNDWLCNQQQIFGAQRQAPLEELDPPFIWVNRDGGGHAPYAGYEDDGQSYEDDNAKEYLQKRAGDMEQLQNEYEQGIDEFHERVKETIQYLDRNGLREETLVIITSDHGELLGEYGQVGHDFPAVPELVYVPTTFVHPSIEPGAVTEEVMRHIDLLPTVIDCLDLDGESLPGTNVTMGGYPEQGICHYNRSFSDIIQVGLRSVPLVSTSVTDHLPDVQLDLRGVWDFAGGYTFNEAGLPARWIILLLRLALTPEGRHVTRQRTFRECHREIMFDDRSYGEPAFSKAKAEELLEGYSAIESEAGSVVQLDEKSRKQLEGLGYL